MLKDRTDDASRFARFLRREAADYHDPPEAPAEAMWAGVEARLGAAPVPDSPESADVTDAAAGVGAALEHPFDVLGYNDPPPAPREAMWERIEAGWAAGQREVAAARGASRGPLRLVVARTLGRRPGRTAAWLTGAAAASVALAVALDGGSQLPVPAEPEMVAATAAARPATPASVAATDSGPLAATAAEEALALAVVEEPLETSRQFASATPPAAADPAPTPARPAADPPTREAVGLASAQPEGPEPSRGAAADYEMAEHLDRAAMLLVAFRTDIGSDESQQDLASWAREVLVETRSLLAAPIGDGERERALLRDLELILVQIARLGPDAPAFERELAREGLDQQGTLLRLRSAIGT
ncbi:hypothetical protein [Candidatus Palauibacter sp.]|uniref:hypothetical protein n=1 Tax=Candidatus Palauibacter sp. TaxID=3101350 RepID=UPI003B52CD67